MPLPFFDDFNRANEAPIAAPWVNGTSSAWALQANELVSSFQNSPSFVHVDSTGSGHDPVSNVRVTVTAVNGGAGNFDAGPTGRSTGTPGSSCYAADYYTSGGTVQFYRYPGNNAIAPSWPIVMANGDELSIEIEGTNPVILRAYKNGGLIGSTTDGSGARLQGPGQGGVFAWENVNEFDDFLVEDLDAGGPAGRIMGKLAGVGALAAEGGLAGASGGLAG